jgi:uncharacterized membrane protein
VPSIVGSTAPDSPGGRVALAVVVVLVAAVWLSFAVGTGVAAVAVTGALLALVASAFVPLPSVARRAAGAPAPAW